MGKRRLGGAGRYTSDPWERKDCRHSLYIKEVGTSEERPPGCLYRDGCLTFDRVNTFCDHLSGVDRDSPAGMLLDLGRFMLLSHYCQSIIIPPVCWITLVLAPWGSSLPNRSVQAAPLHTLLKAVNMCLASTLISVSSVLNFSLAALLAVTLGIPLSLASPSNSLLTRGIKCTLYTALAFGWLAFDTEVKQGVWDWQVLGAWFAPLVCLVYVPFVLQAGIVSSLEP
jgi:hypothetical protein